MVQMVTKAAQQIGVFPTIQLQMSALKRLTPRMLGMWLSATSGPV